MNTSAVTNTVRAGIVLLVFLLIGCSTPLSVGPPAELEQVDRNIIRFQFKDPEIKEQEHIGTGFIYQAAQLVVTCAHVLPDQDDLTVSLASDPDREVMVRVLHRDVQKDLAVLEIFEGWSNTYLLPRSENVYAGLPVLTYGYSSHVDQYDGLYCSGGVVAQPTEQFIEVDGEPYQFALADIRVSVGNSGGPLLDWNGDVIGIVHGVTYSGSGSTTYYTPVSGIDAYLEETGARAQIFQR
jgi:S1-C subfamily serine protease